MRYLTWKNELDVEQALHAIVAYPTLEQAVEYLKDQKRTTTVETLRVFRDVQFKDRYQKLREELAPTLEAMAADDMLDNARLAAEVERLAIEKTRELLVAGKITEPAKVARELSQVKTQSIDKRLALQGRPTQITERRDVSEIVNALVGMKVAVAIQPSEQPQLQEGEIDG